MCFRYFVQKVALPEAAATSHLHSAAEGWPGFPQHFALDECLYDRCKVLSLIPHQLQLLEFVTCTRKQQLGRCIPPLMPNLGGNRTLG